MPIFFSKSSMPVYLERFHSPSLRAALACGMWRARLRMWPTVSSAAETMFEVGRVDHHDAGLGGGLDVHVVQADAGAGDDLEVLGGGDGLGVHLGGGADQDRVDVGDRGEQLGTVGAVGLADFEVRAEGLDCGGRKFFGEQYYGF